MVFQKPLCQIAKKARCSLNLMILLLHSDSDGPKVSNKSDLSTLDFLSFCLFKEEPHNNSSHFDTFGGDY